MTQLSDDASVQAAGHVAGEHTDWLFGVLYEAKRMKDAYTDEQKEIIEDSVSPEMDRLMIVQAMSRISDDALAEWEKKLLVPEGWQMVQRMNCMNIRISGSLPCSLCSWRK